MRTERGRPSRLMTVKSLGAELGALFWCEEKGQMLDRNLEKMLAVMDKRRECFKT